MEAAYGYNKITSIDTFSESLGILMPEAKIISNPKDDKFESYGEGVNNDNFFIGDVFTNHIDSITIKNLNSYILSLPKIGGCSITSLNKKGFNIPNKNGSLILPTEKIIYDTPTDITEDYEIILPKKLIDKVITEKYNIPQEYPDILILDYKNDKVQALYKFIDSTLSILRNFSGSRDSIFVKKNIEEISTLMLAEIIAEQINATPLLNSNPEKGLLLKAEDIIDTNCSTIFTVQEIADKTFTSVRNLQLLFKKYRDYTPMQFLRARKLHKAHKNILLSNAKCSVKEIAFGVGMFDLSSFSKYYAEIFGELPSETIRKKID